MDRITVICRPARESDTADVIELTRTIWDGHDYVPEAWPKWLADPVGRLTVAEYQGRVIGLVKISRQAPGAWWLSGLRAHPGFEGRGVASQLHQAAVEAWQQIGDGPVRLATYRPQVMHLCERTGFERVGEFSVFAAVQNAKGEVRDAGVDLHSGELPFAAIQSDEVDELIAFLRRSPTFQLQSGLLELYWQYAPPVETFLRESIEAGMAWWWRRREGALLAYEAEEDDTRLLYVRALACETEQISPLLGDFRRLAGALGYTGAAWVAPLVRPVLNALAENGFERQWEHAVFVYTKTKQ